MVLERVSDTHIFREDIQIEGNEAMITTGSRSYANKFEFRKMKMLVGPVSENAMPLPK